MSELVPIVALFIPIAICIIGGIVAGTAIYLHYKKRKEMYALYHQERMAAIDKGIELPPLPNGFLCEAEKRRTSPRHNLLKGMTWLLVGVSLLIAVRAFDTAIALFALIPIAIGVAHLIFYFAVAKKEADAIEAAQKNRVEPPTATPVR